ncbi:unnamed protein product [Acanthoscelides obtectus]|uniref:Uncharacterized protein n=1 Tax=Acanthoscelides obtectus TaxID=200917 RepID=A0A9P0K454_ACAOB|nr:unnamed protein product [Acanthoscelides obtectus]CAK1663983.1 hypothetical protein AOBTE_LOCUS23981 [Acanthoscelides obtectus]
MTTFAKKLKLSGSTSRGHGAFVRNRNLIDVWIEAPRGNRKQVVYEKILSLIDITDEPSKHLKSNIMKCSQLFGLKIANKWQKVGQSRNRLLQNQVYWLDKIIYRINNDSEENTSSDEEQEPPCRSVGRPRVPFEDASKKTKRRRVAELTTDRSANELQFAVNVVSGSNHSEVSPQIFSFSTAEALALMVDLDISVRKYLLLRSVINGKAQNCLARYKELQKTKNAIIPSQFIITEISAEVDLQELLQKTAESILETMNFEERDCRIKVICKWGFDGSSGHSQYKQKFSDLENTVEFLFLVAMTPLRLIDRETNKVLWKNESPSSTLYCRPIKFLFKKENADLVRNTEKEIITKIEKLIPIKIKTKEGHSYIIEVDMMLAMLDGSVGNVLSETNSTMKCIICGATPKDMNTLAEINRPPNVDNDRFGLSTLHCWIRFFECLLHIGYRLPIKSWQVRGPENKAIVEAKKKRIQAEFRAKLSLIVDKPKPGYGSSNDGNTARIFFHNPQTSSDITGVDRELIENIAIILGVLASGCAIDMEKYASLLEEARNLYIHLYKWYNIPNTVHKVLVHGCEIIDAFCLPIGELSEDALEARHKEVRKHRLSHTRKCSRTDTNKDLMRVLLLTSDPFISSKRKVSSKKYKKCNEAVQNYLEKQENGDLGIDLGTITNDRAPSKKSYSD